MHITLAPNEFLDDYVLNVEFAAYAGVSLNAHRFWKGLISAKFENSRIIFLHKKSIPNKFRHIPPLCSDLSGLVLTSAFCSLTTLAASHLVEKNNSRLYSLFEFKKICGIKFINLRKFYDDLGLDYSYRIYIEKCSFFSPTPLERRIKLTDTMCLGYY
ncbi:cysteine permease [Campylobacter sp.]|uniref:cysteine permease n=1 Tax=Campylobacter sp. TaxID=205 RepID=UPI0027018C03|nr:cysteine permease [Campylobacter sp.]